MARIEETEAALRVHLMRWEAVGALHRGFDIPRESIVADEVVLDGWLHLRGWRCPGTGIPGVIMLGTTRGRGIKDFCAVYGHRPARVITCRDFAFARVLVSDSK